MTTSDPLLLAIVDDDDDVRMALSRLLRAMGHQVTAFASAEDFEAADSATVDCAIVDIRLPGLSGLELRERLRNRAEPPPVVLITGDGERLACDIGCEMDTPLLTKPFDAAALSAGITSAIAMAALQRARHAH
jgi:FixJ family two-component response regulator